MADERSKKGAILVIGGGIAGITAAVEAAEVGYPVHLIEKEPFLGGRVIRINQYFPKLCPPACGMEINFKRIKNNPLITCYTMAEVAEVRGGEGAYEVKVKIRPRFVNERCTACGKCGEVCQTEISNPLNYGMDQMRAAYLPREMAFPERYVLAPEIIGTVEGKRCQEACAYGAIDLTMAPKTVELKVTSIVVATGWEPYDAARVDNLGFGKIKNVINNVMMERLAAANGPQGGRIVRPSDGKEVKNIAFCQCAGQRDENHLPFCSRVCCLASLKQARYVRQQYPDSKVYVFYIDLRAMGRNEDFLAEIQADDKVQLIKGKIAKVTEDPSTKDVIVEAEATAVGAISRLQVDMLVLATGMVPSTAREKIPGIPAGYDAYGFILDTPGVYGAGCVKSPSDVSTSVQDATGAALKAIQSAVGR
ncbi:MAG TPA: CoB--CoM heterodisulfide reductase iron-sulfur subunit A family protein [Thermodesulfobacteriota bacterium]|nr:CoB--CoM heterodisulfide reductase iron-sulfur subunit A family protein [Thermodesulfobacteriota bacterium]